LARLRLAIGHFSYAEKKLLIMQKKKPGKKITGKLFFFTGIFFPHRKTFCSTGFFSSTGGFFLGKIRMMMSNACSTAHCTFEIPSTSPAKAV
jgi:hypothetical protein